MSQVESAGLAWAKSSRCDSGTCVEVAWPAGAVAVRDNTVPGVRLTFDRTSWNSLLGAIRANRLDN